MIKLPVVKRCYQAQENTCEKAVELLLRKTPTRKRGVGNGPDNGPDDGPKCKEDSASASIIPERGRTQEVVVALRGLLGHNPRAAGFGLESLSELLYQERFLPYRADASEIECALEVLRGEDGELLA